MEMGVGETYERIGPGPLSPRAMQQMVRMRDGVRLATDVYLPGGESGVHTGVAPGPTVLIRLPYDKTGSYTFIPRIADYVTARGYRVVAQDVRGKFRSEGEPLMFVNEANDGYDTIDWIRHQAWSDGIVGMWGDSYYGYTQWAAVSSAHPALRAISPRLTGTQLGALPPAPSGAGTTEVQTAVGRLYAATYFHDADIHEWEPDWEQRPYLDSVERFFTAVGSRSPSWDLTYPQAVPVRRFPDGHPFDARPVPVLMTIGWWDNCAPWQWADHAELQCRPAWALNEYLFIDSIDHEGYHVRDGEHAADRSEAELDRIVAAALEPTLEFFDVFLRGRAPADSIPRVRWNLAHTEGMRTSAGWPPAEAQAATFTLTADGGLERATTAAGPLPGGAPLTWTHDPDDLVPSRVDNPFAFLLERPDEQTWARRADVLGFVGEACVDSVDLVGPVDFRGIVASSGPRLDLFVRLLDLSPRGDAYLIARGQVHLPEVNGEHTVAVDLGQVGYRLMRGHRLAVHIASSDFPEYLPQPGNGSDPWTATTVMCNEQMLRAGAVLDLSLLEGAQEQGHA